MRFVKLLLTASCAVAMFLAIGCRPGPTVRPLHYARAKKLWLKHAANPNASVAILSNGAAFLEVADKPLAEELLLRGQAKAPYADWAASLGQLHATAIVGSVGGVRMSAVQSVSVEVCK